MKPLRLEMSAFGPYGDKQEIDFTILEGRNIFLVTGVTGAGKTTIFDAISYALFGEPSGSSRETSSLRSHFAADDTETYVDLTFEVKGEVYQIIRAPEQEVKKKRGEGTTVKAASVELLLPKGEKPLTKTLDVQNRVREIVGVDKDQFRQIVMLPQGEFRKLLESKSSDREVIFRKIFGTQAFQRVQIKLRERKTKLSEDLRLDRSSVGIYIKNLKAPEDHPLTLLKGQADIDTTQVKELVETLRGEDEKWVVCQSKQLENIKKQLGIAKIKLTLATENNKKIRTSQETENRLNIHLLQQEAISNQKEVAVLGKKALEVRTIDDEKQLIHKKAMERGRQLEVVAQNEAQSAQILDDITHQVRESKSKEDYRKGLREEISYLTPFKQKLSIYVTKQTALEQVKGQLQLQIQQKTETEDDMRRIKAEIEKNNQAVTESMKAENEGSKIAAVLDGKNRVREALINLHKSNKAYMQKDGEYGIAQKELEKRESEFKKSRADFQNSEDLFRKGQAGLLAEGLEEHMPCPVCGSTHHPAKTTKIKGIPTEDELKVLQVHKEKSESAYQEILSRLGLIQKEREFIMGSMISVQMEGLKEVLGEAYGELRDREQQQNYIVTLGSQLRATIDQLMVTQDQLRHIAEAGNIAAEMKKKWEIQLQEQEQKIAGLNDGIALLGRENATISEQLRQIEEDLPVELRDQQKLEERILWLKKELETSVMALETLLLQEKNMQAQHAANVKDKENKLQELQRVTLELEEADVRLKNILTEKGFITYESYQEAYRDKVSLQQLEDEVLSYEQQLQTLKALFENAKEAAEGLAMIEVEVLDQEVESYAVEESQLIDAISHVKVRLEHNKEQLKFIEATRRKISGKEDEYTLVAELENVAFGDTANKKRMTFESYVLTAYFDEIIFAANRRLEKMSSGRFELRRKEDLAKGRGKQGLDLEVLDYHTGRARDVKTLSGGEGFKASLALALGLADVIQTHAGGISIETMFVDEGFGTLDAASLDSAIECLLGLQQGGRLIGIISHVTELRERVEVALEVKTSTRGSKAEFVL